MILDVAREVVCAIVMAELAYMRAYGYLTFFITGYAIGWYITRDDA
jgi:hypothetical protein